MRANSDLFDVANLGYWVIWFLMVSHDISYPMNVRENVSSEKTLLLGEKGCIDFQVFDSLISNQIVLLVPLDRPHQRRPNKDHQLVFRELEEE